MCPQIDERKRVKLPLAGCPVPDGKLPDRYLHARTPSRMKAELQADCHRVTEDPNGLYMEARHGFLPVVLRFFIPAHDNPWTVSDFARLLRALMLWGFFALAGAFAIAPRETLGAVAYFMGWLQ